MGIFGIKKNKEEEEEREELRSKNPTTRKVSRGRKKEQPKPWGKRERLIVFYTLSISVFFSAVLAASARNWKLPGLPKISMPKISLFGEGTIIIEGEAEPDDLKKTEEIRDGFKEKTKNLSGVYGLYVMDLNKGYSFAVNGGETYQAASLMKLPVMLSIYIEEEEGNVELETEYELEDGDKIGGSGSLQYETQGLMLTYRELIEYMGQESDNTAFGIARDLLGEEKIKETIQKIGMTDTSFDENETTLEDIGLLFQKLWTGEIISIDSRDELLGFLTDTTYEDHLTAGVPTDIKVAHKYGREIHVVADAGIVLGEKPYVVVIMTQGVVESEVDEIFPELSELVYNGLLN